MADFFNLNKPLTAPGIGKPYNPSNPFLRGVTSLAKSVASGAASIANQAGIPRGSFLAPLGMVASGLSSAAKTAQRASQPGLMPAAAASPAPVSAPSSPVTVPRTNPAPAVHQNAPYSPQGGYSGAATPSYGSPLPLKAPTAPATNYTPGRPTPQDASSFNTTLMPPAPMTTANSTPSTPSVVPNAATAARDALRAQLAATYNPSASEIALQDQITGKTGDLNQMGVDLQSGVLGVEGQGRGIPLQIIRGQQEKITRQGLMQQQTAQGELQTMEQRLANQLAQRKNQQQVVNTQLGYADQDYEEQQALTKPLEVGGQLLKFNPATGTYDVAYSSPGTAEKPVAINGRLVNPITGEVIYESPPDAQEQKTVTLSEGQRMYDAQGNLIAENPKGSNGGEQKFTSVSPGSTIIDEQGRVVYTAPAAPKPGAADPVAASREIDGVVALIDQIISNPLLENVVGFGGATNWQNYVPGTNEQYTKALIQKLQSQLALAGRQALKGQGTISDREFAVLTKASAALGEPGKAVPMNKADVLTELEAIKTSLTERKTFLQSGGVDQTVGGGDELTAPDGTVYVPDGYGGYVPKAGDLSRSVNGSASVAIASVAPDGAKGGQCGAFVHKVVANYPYGLNTYRQKEQVINVPRSSTPKVGDVVIQNTGDSTGHVSVINRVNPDGTITLTESNFYDKSRPETVTNTRTISLGNRSISGYYRGSLRSDIFA